MKAPPLHAMDEVALQKDLPEHQLRYGDVGVIVKAFRDGTCDVEFENALGKVVVLNQFPKEELLQVRNSRH